MRNCAAGFHSLSALSFHFWLTPHALVNRCLPSVCLHLHFFVITVNRYDSTVSLTKKIKKMFYLQKKTLTQHRCYCLNTFNLRVVFSDSLVCNFSSPFYVRFCAGSQRVGVRNPAAEKSASRENCSVLRMSEGSQ